MGVAGSGNGFYGNSGDIEGALEDVELSAINAGLSPTDIGILRAILKKVGGLLAGEANGVMYSQFDAAPPAGPPGPIPQVLNTNSVANANRDGNNAEYIIDFITDGRTAVSCCRSPTANRHPGRRDGKRRDTANNVLDPTQPLRPSRPPWTAQGGGH